MGIVARFDRYMVINYELLRHCKPVDVPRLRLVGLGHTPRLSRIFDSVYQKLGGRWPERAFFSGLDFSLFATGD